MLQSDTLNPAMLINTFCKPENRDMTLAHFRASQKAADDRFAQGAETLSINRIVFTKAEILACYHFYSREENWLTFEKRFREWNFNESLQQPGYFRKMPAGLAFSWKKVLITVIAFTPVAIYRVVKAPSKSDLPTKQMDLPAHLSAEQIDSLIFAQKIR